MQRLRLMAVFASALFPALVACTDSAVAPESRASHVRSPTLDVLPTLIEYTVTAEEFSLADADKSGKACAKETSSANVLLKDANEATPSQLCPPAWQQLVAGTKVIIHNEWVDEDTNRNGQVCTKPIGTDKTIVKDDNLATPSQPCPPAFSVTYVRKPAGPKVDFDDVIAADDDRDRLVCVNALATGNFIARDDNNATPSQPCPPAWTVVAGSTNEGPSEPEGPAKP